MGLKWGVWSRQRGLRMRTEEGEGRVQKNRRGAREGEFLE